MGRRAVERAGKLPGAIGRVDALSGGCHVAPGLVPGMCLLAVLLPDELRGMKRPFKAVGRGLGLTKCNPFRNCKRFHMTRFQPHPDTEDPGLFGQSAGTGEGARCL